MNRFDWKRLAAVFLAALCLMLCACGDKDAGEDAGEVAESSAESDASQEQLLFVAEQAEHIIMRGSALQEGEEATLQAELGLVGPTGFFTIGADKDGLRLMGVAQNNGQNFAEDFDLPGAFDEEGAFKASYYAQITTVDIDQDSELEVVVCIGNKATEMQTVVYRCTGGQRPFEAAGRIDGQVQMTLRDEEFLVPNTEPQLGQKFRYKDGGIEEA